MASYSYLKLSNIGASQPMDPSNVEHAKHARLRGWHRWSTLPQLGLSSRDSVLSHQPDRSRGRLTELGHPHDESASEVVSVRCDGRESTLRLSSASPEAKDSQHLNSAYSCRSLERVAGSFKHSPIFNLYVTSNNSTTTPSNTRCDRDPPTHHARRGESANGLGLSKGIPLKNRLLPQWHVPVQPKHSLC